MPEDLEHLTPEQKLAKIYRKIDAFADLMRERMQQNIHKDSWTDQKAGMILLQAVEEMGELSSALLGKSVGGTMQTVYTAADVANFMLMLADVVWGLDGPKEPDEE